MVNERDIICYNLLNEVFTENAYASLRLNSRLSELSDEKDRAYISNLFYGIIEKSVQFDYIIRKLAGKKPKSSIDIIIKLGLYHMRYMSTPPYAAINNAVDLAKKLGKTGVSGFINAVLRKSVDLNLPTEGELDDVRYLSVTYSIPLWICRKMISQYGYPFAKEFFAVESNKKTHIRHNSRLINKEEFEAKLEQFGYDKSRMGYFVSHNALVGLNRSLYTPQSLSSMIAVQFYLDDKKEPETVLDLCGAPGGKSVYLNELCPNSKIYCCDIHPHRVELIKKYAKRMGSNIVPLLCDATKILPEWINKCDMVICDVPCSGIGVYKQKPDILFNKKEDDIKKIASLQSEILENAKSYVNLGGLLCYSTCTVLKEENDDIVDAFLRANPSFVLERSNSPFVGENDGKLRLFPNLNGGCDGFFAARMRRIS